MLDEALSIFPLIKFGLKLKILFIVITVISLLVLCSIILVNLDKLKKNYKNDLKIIILIEIFKILTGVIYGTITGIYITAIIFYFYDFI